MIAPHELRVAVDVIPHHKLTEGEQTQQGLFYDIPAGVLLDVSPDDREDGAQVYAAVVLGQRQQPVEGQSELLSQHLHEGGVERCLLLSHAQHIAAGTFPHQSDGQHHQWGIAWHDALLGLIPFQHSQCQEQCVGTVLLHCCARIAVECLDGIWQFVVVEIGV